MLPELPRDLLAALSALPKYEFRNFASYFVSAEVPTTGNPASYSQTLDEVTVDVGVADDVDADVDIIITRTD